MDVERADDDSSSVSSVEPFYAPAGPAPPPLPFAEGDVLEIIQVVTENGQTVIHTRKLKSRFSIQAVGPVITFALSAIRTIGQRVMERFAQTRVHG